MNNTGTALNMHGDVVITLRGAHTDKRPKAALKLEEHLKADTPIDYDLLGTMYSCYVHSHNIEFDQHGILERFTLYMTPKTP